ncbi:hypothetical protein PVMG_05972 [Plasmodium vivax Mauritania I]|uniref:Variable surface protein n=1 Tax=Plasmodium vivax Mauritania I TaxID=1035515 RepID=A0A0J9THJ5_PLAVI|nr:hypothetical protein PVMG_05972 [Plasmodium vivax Mauritania I]
MNYNENFSYKIKNCVTLFNIFILQENIIKELTSSKIYDKLNEDVSGNEYKSEHCDNLKFDNDQMKTICKNMENNIKKLPNNSKMNDLSHRDRCTYLNFWIYDEISKLYKNEDKNLTDITDVAKLIDANININMDLIKDDFKKNNDKLKQQTTITDQRAKSTNSTSPKTPAKFVKHYELSKHEPCYFNYNFIKLSIKNYYFIKYLLFYRLILHLKKEYSNKMTLFCFPCTSYYIINIKKLSIFKIIHCKNIDIHVKIL